jgi:hypothetical protein
VVLQEITKLLEDGDREVVSQPMQKPISLAMDRFSRMPKAVKNAIYGKLYEICKPFANGYWGCAEHAFYGQHGQSASPAQKAQAIKNYLDDQLPKNNPLLLAHLGFKTEKDYLEKLKCRSEYLQKIGILSPKDLELICSASADLSQLEILQVVEIEEDFRENRVKIEAERRKNNLVTLIEEMSKVVESKKKETQTCGVLLYQAECPWIAFQQKIRAFQTKFEGIVEKSDTAKLMVENFCSKNYNGLARELNALVEEFHVKDRDHQIAKLHAYINQQWGILKAWTRRRNEGTQSLKDLPESERPLQKLFQMGE